MGWYDDDRNVSYYPEKHGLTEFGVLEAGGGYDFDTLIVWQHEDGTLYWATDAGCSCPTPFEDYQNLESLNRLDRRSWSAFEAEVKNHGEYAYNPTELAAKKVDLLARVSPLVPH